MHAFYFFFKMMPIIILMDCQLDVFIIVSIDTEILWINFAKNLSLYFKPINVFAKVSLLWNVIWLTLSFFDFFFLSSSIVLLFVFLVVDLDFFFKKDLWSSGVKSGHYGSGGEIYIDNWKTQNLKSSVRKGNPGLLSKSITGHMIQMVILFWCFLNSHQIRKFPWLAKK